MSQTPTTEAAYARFRQQLEAGTRLDAVAYADWIRENLRELRSGLGLSGEDDPVVYCRMRYVEFRRSGGVRL